MTLVIIYSVLAILIFILAAMLARPGRVQTPADIGTEESLSTNPFEASALYLGEKLFDPADYLWLYDELCFPEAARALGESRKELAIKWLRVLRGSFNALVRQAEPAPDARGIRRDTSGWRLLWLTFKFHFLLNYALFVVHNFGPYNKLIPSFGWVHAVLPIGRRRRRFLAAGLHYLN